eukprot:1014725-Pelagomonas_calceolata.AAC.1
MGFEAGADVGVAANVAEEERDHWEGLRIWQPTTFERLSHLSSMPEWKPICMTDEQAQAAGILKMCHF